VFLRQVESLESQAFQQRSPAAKGFVITVLWWDSYGLPSATACGVRIDWYRWPSKPSSSRGNRMASYSTERVFGRETAAGGDAQMEALVMLVAHLPAAFAVYRGLKREAMISKGAPRLDPWWDGPNTAAHLQTTPPAGAAPVVINLDSGDEQEEAGNPPAELVDLVKPCACSWEWPATGVIQQGRTNEEAVSGVVQKGTHTPGYILAILASDRWHTRERVLQSLVECGAIGPVRQVSKVIVDQSRNLSTEVSLQVVVTRRIRNEHKIQTRRPAKSGPSDQV